MRFVLVGAVVLLLTGCGAAGDGRKVDGRASPRTEGDERPENGERRRAFHLVPRTYRDGDHVLLPATFTDGTRIELLYPRRLGIADLGVVPYGSGRLEGKSPTPRRGDRVGRDFLVLRGKLEDVLRTFNGGRPPPLLAGYVSSGGRSVGFWGLSGGGLAVNYLGFQFGDWAVLVYDYPSGNAAAMTEGERAAWSASFSGHETEDGFLVLEGSGPLRLAAAGEHAGPQLKFGSVEPPRSLALFLGPCEPHADQTRLVGGTRVQWGGKFADWCVSDSLRAHATGTDEFVGALIRDLRVR